MGADRERPAAAGEAAGLPLLSSRLVAPEPPAGCLDRPRLRQLLDAGADAPVTLVAAPVGWGKTVLLSSWARANRGAVAWLSVETGSGPILAYLSAGLRAAAAALSSPSAQPDQVLPAQPDQACWVRLAEAIARLPAPLTLVIDDLHQLRDRAALPGLEFLLRHAGGRLRLVIGARAEPAMRLHRWRLSGQLVEIRAPQLAFTAAETASLLAGHGRHLPASQVADLTERVEGWPAGLRLAMLTLPPGPGPAILNGFSGDDQRVGDYLSDEVLAQLPAEVAEAMVDASVLEWLCGGAVDALTGRTDGERLLSGFARTNLFVIPLGGHPATYRYHRSFGEFLRGELRRRRPGAASDLHRRAARWCAGQALPEQALGPALAARDWRYATDLFVAGWPDLVCRGHRRPDRPPPPEPPAERVAAEPELGLAFAAECLRRGELAAADHAVQLAEHHQRRRSGDRWERFAVLVGALRLARCGLGGDPAAEQAAAADLLARLSAERAAAKPAGAGASAVALAALGAAQLDLGELDRAEASLGLVLASPAGAGCRLVRCGARLALVRALRGQLDSALSAALAALGLPPCPGQPVAVHTAPAYLAGAIVDLHQDRPGDAAARLDLAAAGCDPATEPELAATVAAVRARLHHQRGELDAACASLLAARHQPASRPLSVAAQRRLALVEAEIRAAGRGGPAAVRKLLEPWLAEPGPDGAELRVALARACLHEGDLGGAMRQLPAWEAEQHPPVPLVTRVDAGLLDALAADRRGDRRRRFRALERVLQLAEVEGVRRAFTRSGPAVVDLLAGHLDSGTAYWPLVRELVGAGRPGPLPATPVAGPDPPLTERELTVLRYLQSTLSTGEIAAELSLSVNTVKTHLRSIYRKLDTTRRREAVRRARQLRLL